ncbi:hypothetical protein [Candidatus Methylacidithermus pantelleriae]|uniref:hypothetical protein n=1 Tax=Candidatus Methylacidithermus pantelleriae TaxID=2744239 RepID=UPI00157C6AE5|nr:hypothetical protein [Candidatus Methylacidithermus pantelleriae]
MGLFFFLPLLWVGLPLVGMILGVFFAGGHLCWHETIGTLAGFLLANAIAIALLRWIAKQS